MSKQTKPKIIIFEEPDGYHWNILEEAQKRGYFDARGKSYPTRATARRAARVALSLDR